MKLAKRQARAKARKKAMTVIKNQKCPATVSKFKFGGGGVEKFYGLTPGEAMSAKKKARKPDEPDQS